MRKNLLIALAMGVAILSVALADDEETSSTATVEAKAKSQFSVLYGGIYQGGQLSNPGSADSPSGTAEDSGAPQYVNNVVFARFHANENLVIGPRFEFDYQLTKGQNITLADFAIRAMQSNLIKTSNFDLSSDLRLYLPTTQASQNHGIIAGLRTTHYANYRVARWTLSAAGYLWANFFNAQNTVGTAYRGNLNWYVAPGINYQLNPKLAFMFLYEMGGRNNLGKSIFDQTSLSPDFQAGVSYDFSENFNLTPFVQIFPAESVDMKHAMIGMYITAKLI
jgi:hypothetical protein